METQMPNLDQPDTVDELPAEAFARLNATTERLLRKRYACVVPVESDGQEPDE